MAMKAQLYQGRRHCDNSGRRCSNFGCFDLTIKTGAQVRSEYQESSWAIRTPSSTIFVIFSIEVASQ
jgi:hypothetical protein